MGIQNTHEERPPTQWRENFSGPTALAIILLALILCATFVGVVIMSTQ